MSKPYTDEDVEVVADLAMVAHWGDASWKDEAVTILEAVAPAIIRRAKAEALRRVAIEHGSITDTGLMDIADQIEAAE